MKKPRYVLSRTEIASLMMLGMTAIVLVGLQEKLLGWSMYALAIFFTALGTKSEFRNYIILLFGSLGVLGLVPITTDIGNENILRMGSVLLFALALPYLVSKYYFKDNLIDFRFNTKRAWSRTELVYVISTVVAAYFFLPFYLENTGAYLNWSVENNTESIFRLFVGTNALGLWDELFFVSTVLGVLRRFMPFNWANILQAVLFTSFLYELGFTGWGPLVIYPFALIQGYIFRQTNSLFYVIVIHLSLDFVLFLALLNAHHPELASVFVT